MFETTQVITGLAGLLTLLGMLVIWIKYNVKEVDANKKISKAIQTEQNLNDKESKTVQTEIMRFTERITNFGSGEIFENCCDICEPNLEKEAAGFCKHCEKFMCLNCCKNHEKIPPCVSHVLLDKKNYPSDDKDIPKNENSLIPIQTFKFTGCHCSYQYCFEEHNVKGLGLSKLPGTEEITCVLQSFIRNTGTRLSFRYQDNKTGYMKYGYISEQSFLAHDFCSFNAITNDITNESKKGLVKNTIYFTIPSQTTIWKWNECKENSPSNKKQTLSCNSYKGETTQAFFKNGECYGIAVFDDGLAISLYLTTTYTLPDWQVQYVTYDGNIKHQIYYDNKGEPMFKEPKYLTSNDAQDILYVSDHAAHAIIALDKKGTVLFTFTSETIKFPMGLTCDDEGNIYVTSGINVIQINQYGTKSRVILGAKKKEPQILIDVCFNKLSQKFAVLNKFAEVTVFKFLPKH